MLDSKVIFASAGGRPRLGNRPSCNLLEVLRTLNKRKPNTYDNLFKHWALFLLVGRPLDAGERVELKLWGRAHWGCSLWEGVCESEHCRLL